MRRLSESLRRCKNSVVVGLTATPIITHAEDGRLLKKIFKGFNWASRDERGPPRGRNDEGVVSYFYSTPSSIYPEVVNAKKQIVNLKQNLASSIVEVPLESYAGKINGRFEWGNAEFYAHKWFEFTRRFKSDTFQGILLAKKEGDSEWKEYPSVDAASTTLSIYSGKINEATNPDSGPVQGYHFKWKNTRPLLIQALDSSAWSSTNESDFVLQQEQETARKEVIKLQAFCNSVYGTWGPGSKKLDERDLLSFGGPGADQNTKCFFDQARSPESAVPPLPHAPAVLFASKLAKIAEDIASRPGEKALILIDMTAGFRTLLRMMNQCATLKFEHDAMQEIPGLFNSKTNKNP